jgi:predicted small integral membrane protein
MSGHQLRFVNWVRNAWSDIQRSHEEWVFLKSYADCTLTAAQETFQVAALGVTDLKVPLNVFILIDDRWSEIESVISLSSANSLSLANKQAGRPCIAYFSNGVLSFDTIPDSAYSLRIHYRAVPQELNANTDIPLCESMYHMTIVWGAVKRYAQSDEDQSLFNAANAEYRRCMLEMLNALTPKITFSPSAF